MSSENIIEQLQNDGWHVNPEWIKYLLSQYETIPSSIINTIKSYLSINFLTAINMNQTVIQSPSIVLQYDVNVSSNIHEDERNNVLVWFECLEIIDITKPSKQRIESQFNYLYKNYKLDSTQLSNNTSLDDVLDANSDDKYEYNKYNKRLLKLLLTDGCSNIVGIELKPCNILNNITYGSKIKISICKSDSSKILWLTPDKIKDIIQNKPMNIPHMNLPNMKIRNSQVECPLYHMKYVFKKHKEIINDRYVNYNLFENKSPISNKTSRQDTEPIYLYID